MDEPTVRHSDPAPAPTDEPLETPPRCCAECGGELLWDERLVCRGRCARARKTRLQKERRQQRRPQI